MGTKPVFQTAQDFLAQRIQFGNIVKRVAVTINANIGNLSNSIDIGRRIDAIFEFAFDKVEAAIDEKLSAISDKNQKLAVEFFYAQSRGISAQRQVEMLADSGYSSTVSLAAAKQRNIPDALQSALIDNCSSHVDSMRALVSHTDINPKYLLPLAEHQHYDVRFSLAEHIGNRMRITENLTNEKQNVYNTIVDHYDGDFADFLVPVCKNPDQIQQMFDQTPMLPGKVRLFVENPYSPDRVLLDIVSSTTTKFLPGGNDVIEDAKRLLDNRINKNESTPTPDF